MELITGEKTLTEVEIPRAFFQGDVLSPLLFVIVMMPLNHILRKCIGNPKFTKSQEKINPLMYIDDIKPFAKNEKELETTTDNMAIQSGYMNGIWLRKMCSAYNQKRERTDNGRNRTVKSRKNQNAWRKGNLRVLRNIESSHHQTSGDERKNKKEYLRQTSKLLEINSAAVISSKG